MADDMFSGWGLAHAVVEASPVQPDVVPTWLGVAARHHARRGRHVPLRPRRRGGHAGSRHARRGVRVRGVAPARAVLWHRTSSLAARCRTPKPTFRKPGLRRPRRSLSNCSSASFPTRLHGRCYLRPVAARLASSTRDRSDQRRRPQMRIVLAHDGDGTVIEDIGADGIDVVVAGAEAALWGSVST